MTAASLLLDDFPNRKLFFRLVASDSTAAIALADRVRQSGVSTTALVYVDDAFGRPFAQATAAALRNRRVSISVDVPGATLTVERMDGRRIDEVRVTPRSDNPEVTGSEVPATTPTRDEGGGA